MLEFVLLRHGESEGNRDRFFGGHGPSRLTPLGHLQASAAADAIGSGGGAPIDAIYMSDLPRAVETAAPLARKAGLVPIETAALRERSVGDLTGLRFEEAKERFPDLWAALFRRDLEWCPPGGESHRMCSRRVGALLLELLARHPAGRVVLVSHGVAIDHLLRHFLGVEDAAEMRFVFHVDNGSIHRIQRREDGLWRIVSLNDTSHLAGIAGAPDERVTAERPRE
ncbi:MAG: histidine phosphatase family protein [Myxococcales bacterium]|nr:histidine phosphatase family protein [Myxococcales bacterium]